MPSLSAAARELLANARVAHLATADQYARPHAVPIVFVWREGILYTPLDRKPKREDDWHALRRVRNIETNGRVAVVVDRYDEDWSRLAWVMLEGVATILESGEERDAAAALLREKYAQYENAVARRPSDRAGGDRARAASGLAGSLRLRRAALPLPVAAHLGSVAAVVHVAPAASVVAAPIDEEPFACGGPAFAYANEIVVGAEQFGGGTGDLPERPLEHQLVRPCVAHARASLLKTSVPQRSELLVVNKREVGRLGSRVLRESIEGAPDPLPKRDRAPEYGCGARWAGGRPPRQAHAPATAETVPA